MSVSLNIYGQTYNGVQGIKAKDTNGTTRIFTLGGSGTDTSDATLNSGGQMLSGVTAYANGTKYTGTIPTRTSADLTATGSTVTVASGYYSSQTTKSIQNGSAATPATTLSFAPAISVNASGVVTATVSGSSMVTPTVTAGYVSAGTSGRITVSATSTYQLTSLAATTYNVSTVNQTIASAMYLTGNQTIRAVTYAGLTASNIASGVTVTIGDSADADRIVSVTGTLSFVTYYTGTGAPSSSLGNDGDIYLQTS